MVLIPYADDYQVCWWIYWRESCGAVVLAGIMHAHCHRPYCSLLVSIFAQQNPSRFEIQRIIVFHAQMLYSGNTFAQQNHQAINQTLYYWPHLVCGYAGGAGGVGRRSPAQATILCDRVCFGIDFTSCLHLMMLARWRGACYSRRPLHSNLPNML